MLKNYDTIVLTKENGKYVPKIKCGTSYVYPSDVTDILIPDLNYYADNISDEEIMIRNIRLNKEISGGK